MSEENTKEFSRVIAALEKKASEDIERAREMEKLTGIISSVEKKVDHVTDMIEKNYVTRAEFSPVKTICYGLVGLIVSGVVGALLTLIIRK